MKTTTNVFQGGMMLDLAPLSTQQTHLTDALNATFLTYNGNEGILQNDMGNTRIQDANTGHIMGLREGFIPIGMKEHGGVIYIASVNKEGKGEIGTIPSPIIRDFLKESTTMKINPTPITTADKGTGNDYVRISNKFYPGERFLMALDLQKEDESNACSALETQKCCYKFNSNSFQEVTVNYPLIDGYKFSTQYKYIEESEPLVIKHELNSDKGVYKIVLFSQSPSGIFRAGDRLMEPQTYYGKNEKPESYPQWFINYKDTITLNPDLRLMNRGNGLKSYPSTSLPGYLCVKAELNSKEITKFEILKRKDGQLKVPFTVKVYEQGGNPTFNYYTYFPGFWYETNSFSYIKKMKVTCYNEYTGEYLGLQQVRRFGNNINSDVTRDAGKTEIEIIAEPKNITSKLDDGVTLQEADITKCATEIKSSDYWFPVAYTQNFILNPESKSKYCITNRGDFANEWVTEGVPDAIGNSVQMNNRNISMTASSNFYGGLFHIDFGYNCNQQCRLEITFYNQYDDQIGVYTCKFNPYLNDTFGTNDVSEDQLADVIKMTKTIDDITTSYPTVSNINRTQTDVKLLDKYYNTQNKWQLYASGGSVSSYNSINIGDNLIKGKTVEISSFISNQLYTGYTPNLTVKTSYSTKINNIKLSPQTRDENGKVSSYTAGIKRVNAFGSNGYEYPAQYPSGIGYWYIAASSDPKWAVNPYYNYTLTDFQIQTQKLWFNNSSYTDTKQKRLAMSLYNVGKPNTSNGLANFYGSIGMENMDNTLTCLSDTIPVYTTDKILNEKSIKDSSRAIDTTIKMSDILKNSDVRFEYTGVNECFGAKESNELVKALKLETTEAVPHPLAFIRVDRAFKYVKPFSITLSYNTTSVSTVMVTNQKSKRQIRPYIIHQIRTDDLTTGGTKTVNAGKVYTESKNFERASDIDWQSLINDKLSNPELSSRVTSWQEQCYATKTDEPITHTLQSGTYILNATGKIMAGDLTISTTENEAIETFKIDNLKVSKLDYHFVPIVIEVATNSNINVTLNAYVAYLYDIKIGTLNTKDAAPSSSKLYRIKDYNDAHKDSPIVLPLVSCYREAYGNGQKSWPYKMKDITFCNGNKFSLYYPEANYTYFTFSQDSDDVIYWYYQMKRDDELTNQTLSNEQILRDSNLFVSPGEIKILNENTGKVESVASNLGLTSKYKFGDVWK